jgi:hypothetical protein
MADRRGDRGVGGRNRLAGGSGAAALIEVEVRDGLGLDRVVRVRLVHVGPGSASSGGRAGRAARGAEGWRCGRQAEVAEGGVGGGRSPQPIPGAASRRTHSRGPRCSSSNIF